MQIFDWVYVRQELMRVYVVVFNHTTVANIFTGFLQRFVWLN